MVDSYSISPKILCKLSTADEGDWTSGGLVANCELTGKVFREFRTPLVGSWFSSESSGGCESLEMAKSTLPRWSLFANGQIVVESFLILAIFGRLDSSAVFVSVLL